MEQIRLTGAQETLLATLYAKALDNRSPFPVLGDRTAEGLMARVDYDFAKMKFIGRDRRTVTFRAKKLDEWTTRFLGRHPDATVLHLGCGLDSRAFRLDLPPTVRWIDVDQPDVIELRHKLYPSRDDYQTIATSVTNSSWLDLVPNRRPTLVIAEGLTPYLQEADGLTMLRRLVDHLPGGEMMFDAVLPWTLRIAKHSRLIRTTGASFGWAVGDPRSLEHLVPGLELVEEWSLLDSPHLARARVRDRLAASVMKLARPLRYAHRLLHYRFGAVS